MAISDEYINNNKQTEYSEDLFETFETPLMPNYSQM